MTGVGHRWSFLRAVSGPSPTVGDFPEPTVPSQEFVFLGFAFHGTVSYWTHND